MSIAVAGGLVIVLLIAGTVLRMRTQNLSAWEAFCSFAADTFSLNSF